MPELPEVQTIVNDLNRKIKGRVIVGFRSDWPKGIKSPFFAFKKGIAGRKILMVERKGKNLLFFLDGGLVMLVHLKLTGHLLVKKIAAKNGGNNYFSERVNQYVHHVWQLAGGKNGKPDLTLEFSDLRKFGKIKLIKESELEKEEDLKKLGIDPLSSGFSVDKFREILKKRKNWPIRKILLEQSEIAGIGNIYASEILFDAGISPKRSAEKIFPEEAKEIHHSIIAILKKSLKLRGTSDSDYRDTDGAPGGFQKVLKVYGREKKRCLRRGCSGIVRREKVAQRSSFWCPECQR